MRLVVFEHHEAEGPAALGSALRKQGHHLEHRRLYDGDAVPATLAGVDGLISMGGPMNVQEAGHTPWLEKEMRCLALAVHAQVPVVGVCLGAQLIAAALGGTVSPMVKPEVGWGVVTHTAAAVADPLFAGSERQTTQFHVHGQQVTRLPANAVTLASSGPCRNQAFSIGRFAYGFQYHFEWDRADLAVMVRDPLVARTRQTGERILAQGDECYESYRRSGDQLCHAIATTLFSNHRD